MSDINFPGGGMMQKLPKSLDMYFLLDRSASMTGEKIAQLNHAVREAMPLVQDAMRDNPDVHVFVRCIAFGETADWVVQGRTPVDQFIHTDLIPDGQTAMAAAIEKVAQELENVPGRCLPPVLVLVTDGEPTDGHRLDAAIQHLENSKLGKYAVRIGIAVGQSAKHEPLEKFIGNRERHVLQANTAADMVRYIKWASEHVVELSSAFVVPKHTDADPVGVGPVF